MVGEGGLHKGICDGGSVLILHDAHGLEAIVAAGQVVGDGQCGCNGTAGGHRGVHGGEQPCAALVIHGVDGQLTELLELAAGDDGGGAVHLDLLQIRHTLQAIQGDLGNGGGADLDLLVEESAFGEGDGNLYLTVFLVIVKQGVGIGVGGIVRRYAVVQPDQTVIFTAAGHSESVLQEIRLGPVLCGEGHIDQCVLVSGAVQSEPVAQAVHRGKDLGFGDVDGLSGGGQHPGVGHGGQVESLSAFRIGVDRHCRGLSCQCGLGNLVLAHGEIKITAPEIGEAELEADDIGGTIDAFWIKTNLGFAQNLTAEDRDIFRDLGGAGGIGFPEGIAIFRLLDHDVTAVVMECAHVEGNAQAGIDPGFPVKTACKPVDELHIFKGEVGHGQAEAPEGECGIAAGAQHIEQGVITAQQQGDGRELAGDEEGLIDLVNTGSGTLYPEDSQTVDVDTGLEAAHMESYLVREGDTIGASHCQLRIHMEGNQVRAALHMEGPLLVDDPHVQGAFDGGHTLGVGGDSDTDGGVEADEAAAEENVRDLQVQRAGFDLFEVLNIGLVGLLDLAELVGGVVGLGQLELHRIDGGGLGRSGDIGCGDQEIGIQLRAEGDDMEVRIAIGFRSHDTELAVAEIEDHTCQGLAGAGGTGPEQHQHIGGGSLVLHEPAQGAVVPIDREFDQVALDQGGDGAHALPDLGVGTGGGDQAVDVRLDGSLGTVLIPFHGDGHIAAGDIQTLVDGDDIALLQRHGLQGGHIALGVILGGEVAPEHQQDILQGAMAHILLVFGLVSEQLQVVVPGGSIAAVAGDPGRHDAVGGRAAARILRNLESQSFAGGVIPAGVVPVDDYLPGAGQHPFLQNQVGGIVGGVHQHIFRRDHHIGGAVDGPQDHLVFGGIPQQAEILARQVQVPAAFVVDGGGIDADEGQVIAAHAGAEDVALPAAQDIFLQKQDLSGPGLIAQIKDPHIDLSVIGEVHGLRQVVQGDVPDLTGLQVIDHHEEGGCRRGLAVGIAGGIVDGDTLGGVEGHSQGGNGLGGDVLDPGGQGEITAGLAVQVQVCLLIFGQHHIGGTGEIQRHTALCGVHIGVHAVVKGDGLFAFSIGRDRTHVIVHGNGAVRSQIGIIVRVGEIQGLGVICRRLIVKDGGGKIVPVGEGHLFRLDGGAAYGSIEQVRRHAGGVLVVEGHDVIGVLAAFNGPLGANGGIAAVGLGTHVNGVVLIAQGSVQHDAGLDPVHRFTTDVFHGVGDVNHAVLGVFGSQQGQGLGELQTVDTPGGGDGVFTGFFHSGVIMAQVAVIPAEDIVLDLVAPGDPEGGKGGIVGLIGIEQEFVVIGFGELVTLDGIHQEAAVFRGHPNTEVFVVQFQIAQVIRLRAQGRSGEQPHRQAQTQNQRQDSFDPVVLHNRSS